MQRQQTYLIMYMAILWDPNSSCISRLPGAATAQPPHERPPTYKTCPPRPSPELWQEVSKLGPKQLALLCRVLLQRPVE